MEDWSRETEKLQYNNGTNHCAGRLELLRLDENATFWLGICSSQCNAMLYLKLITQNMYIQDVVNSIYLSTVLESFVQILGEDGRS